ncbi:MAG: alpha/beta fold hydrolase [Phycisphaerales bacterium]|nr:alpha/beta fold hydrolase [Phycisphaerales bacterium]
MLELATLLAQAGAFSNAWLWSAGLTFVGILVLLVYPAVVLRKYVRIMINIIDEQAPDCEPDPRNGNGLHGEDVEFRAADGHLLRGEMLRGNPDRPQRGVVIFAHEFDSDRRSCLRYGRFLLAYGYDLFTFDFRGHGQSAHETGYKPRQFPSDRERSDMLGAIAFVGEWLEQQGRPREVGLFGVSRGAGAAILASAHTDHVKAIILDSAFSSDTTLEYFMKRFATIFAKIRVVAENHPPMFWRFLRWLLFRECRRRYGGSFPSVRRAMRKLGRRPVLLIHGGKDSYIPTAQSQLLYDSAYGPKQLWIVPNAKHNLSALAEPEAYQRRVIDFLDEHLYGVSPVPAPANRSRCIEPPSQAPVRAPMIGAAAVVAPVRRDA